MKTKYAVYLWEVEELTVASCEYQFGSCIYKCTFIKDWIKKESLSPRIQ